MSAAPVAGWFPRSKHGHVIAEVKFGAEGYIECSCGVQVVDGDDESRGHVFVRHRRESLPESKERLRELRPLMLAHAASHGTG